MIYCSVFSTCFMILPDQGFDGRYEVGGFAGAGGAMHDRQFIRRKNSVHCGQLGRVEFTGALGGGGMMAGIRRMRAVGGMADRLEAGGFFADEDLYQLSFFSFV